MRSAPAATVRVPSRSGITRRAPGRRTTASASTICCCRRRRRTASSPPASTSTCAPGRSRRITFRSGSTSNSALEEAVEHVPRQLIVHAHAHDVVVEVDALIARQRQARRRIEIGFVLQSDVEIFELGRPVPAELDLEAGACGPAPMPLLVGDLARRSGDAALDVRQRGAASGVEEPVVPGVADAAAEGRQPALLYLVAEGGIGRKLERAALLVGGRDVALVAEQQAAALNI